MSDHRDKPDMGSPPIADHASVEARLRDGTIAELRPIVPDDRALFAEGLRQMSLASRFARFGSGVASLNEAELRYLTEVDQVSHVAWGATIDSQPAGVGRYIVDGAADAEIAITVVDRFQRIGLGRVLFDALAATARAGGLETVHFAIEPWNRSVLRMLPEVDIVADETDGMLVGRIEIADLSPGDRDAEFVAVIESYRQGEPRHEPPAQRSGSGAGSRSSDAELMQ